MKEWVDIELDSAHRSISIQNEFFEKFKEEYGIEYASKYAAPAGYSEHHTWLAVDICLKKENWEIISENHEMIVELDVFDKVHKKLADYGFILRYPDWKEKITGYEYLAFKIYMRCRYSKRNYGKWINFGRIFE